MTAVGAQARPGLSPRGRAWLIAGAAASFVAFLAAAAFQPEFAAQADPGAHALSRSPAGFAGLVRLLRADGVVVSLNRRSEPSPTVGADPLLVLTPQPTASAADIRKLAHGRRVLLIPAKWRVAPSFERPGRVMALGRWPLQLAATQATAVLDGPVSLSEADGAARPLFAQAPASWRDPAWTPQPVRPVAALRTVAGAGVQSQLEDAHGGVLVAMQPKGVSFVLADPDLLNNHALFDPAGARTAVNLVEELANGAPVVFDLTLAGVPGERSPLRAAFSPQFLPATLAGLLFAALVGRLAAARFGAVRRAGRVYAFGKRALVDTTASLLAVAGREPRLAGRYAELARATAVNAIGLPDNGERAHTDAALDRIGETRGAGAWTALAAEAKAVTRQAQLMDYARRVHAWKTEMTLGRG